MSWAERIDNKVYGAGTILNLGIAVFYGYPDETKIFWLCVLVACAAANHFFTVRALNALITSRLRDVAAPSNWKLFLSVIYKTLFLILGFICLVTYAYDKVLQGLSLYIFQLIILALSIKNIGKFFKKGSNE